MHGADALLTIAWATGAGILAQVAALRLRIPAIVPLLAVGVLRGPSVLGLVRPETLGAGLPVIVKLAVAVILFDGALNLRLSDLRHAITEVRNLVTVGLRGDVVMLLSRGSLPLSALGSELPALGEERLSALGHRRGRPRRWPRADG